MDVIVTSYDQLQYQFGVKKPLKYTSLFSIIMLGIIVLSNRDTREHDFFDITF